MIDVKLLSGALGAEIKVRRGRMNLHAAKQIKLSGRFYLLVQVATSTYVDCNRFCMTLHTYIKHC